MHPTDELGTNNDLDITHNEINSNKMVTVLRELFAESFVPKGNSIAFNYICQLYHIDRLRCYARVPNTDIFINVDDDRFGHEPISNAEANGFDFNRSLYQNGNESKKAILPIMVEHPYIHTLELAQYQDLLMEIGYTTTPDEIVTEAILATMISRTTGIMGYIILERFKPAPLLLESTLVEIKKLLNVILLRIENNETAKQLRKVETYSEHDDLTGLYIFSKFKEDATLLLKENHSYAIFYLDIDKFKYINDIWSFTIANSILIEIAKLIASFIKEGELCSRIGDDNFCMLLKVENDSHLQPIIKKLDHLFQDMQHDKFPDIKITLICGIYFIKDSTTTINLAIDKANVARRTVKGSYNNAFEIYDQSLESLSEREKQLELRTKIALENKEFIPFLQPKFNLITNQICGAEALARWKTEERMIAPFEFIPIFEKNGFITRLDFEIYEQTFQFIHNSLQKGYTLFPISLNVSRAHINDKKFIYKFVNKMEEYNVPSHLIELEITENIFAADKVQLNKFITQIREHGIQVSIDDFGSAYSSLNLLKDIEVDTVKLDKAFIDDITAVDENTGIHKDKIIIQNVVQMITALGFKTIFEGIESQEQIDFLLDIGCELGQGYIFSMPLSLEVFENTFLQK